MALNLHLLRMFVAVARAGSFSRAAEGMNLSQPALSKGVRDFELQVGCRLLNRSQKGVVPTSEGLALLKYAEDLFAAERAAEEMLSSKRNLNNGSLRIGASTTIATYMLAPYLGAFHRAYPGIDLHLVSANTREIAEQMAAQEIDIGLVEGPIDEGVVVAEEWRTDVMKLIVSEHHDFASAMEPIDPQLLGGEVLILREPGSGSREVVAQALASNNIEPLRFLEIGSTAAIKQAVAAGIGVSIVSTVATRDQVRLGYLKAVELRGITVERSLWRLRLSDRTPRPAARVFDNLLDDPEVPNPSDG
ncbi:LysR substrate-binding domain-containing protein [Bradyrhizobium sp. CCGUVB14]|uniref:LysR substrate-binding domain-containing protein n=1 Tax=Bradyrhizobium sp. CCGUVB14 TaxID=2949628 RepID=UPI0020B23CE8|nr:LysR substrate-binding domain-containing protein [Bradyrhizobium sp. CCGUVB14]MCP3440780.1 LysR substrate-binding domain-containing protein [Bradyrhizobium sp. CCGUVB14]